MKSNVWVPYCDYIFIRANPMEFLHFSCFSSAPDITTWEVLFLIRLRFLCLHLVNPTNKVICEEVNTNLPKIKIKYSIPLDLITRLAFTLPFSGHLSINLKPPIYIYIYIYIYTYIYICMYVCMYVCIKYILRHRQTDTHTYTHI